LVGQKVTSPLWSTGRLEIFGLGFTLNYFLGQQSVVQDFFV
jgi:hypothetical protein